MSSSLRIHAGASYYLEQEEPEQTFDGVLREVAVRTGPDTRHLPIHLETREGTVAVYVVGDAAERLARLAGERVRVVGKRIDQRSEGHGIEVWPATVTPLTE